MKKILAILFILLIILILTTVFISSFRNQSSPTIIKTTPVPTTETEYKKSTDLFPTLTGVKNLKDEGKNQIDYKKILDKIVVLSPSDLENLEKIKKQLPYQTDDFDVDYLPLLNQFVLSKKTPLADQKILQWASDNNISHLINDKKLFATTDQSTYEYKKKVEELYQESIEKYIKNKTSVTPVPSIQTESELSLTLTPPNQSVKEFNENLGALLSFINAIVNITTNITLPSSSATQSASPPQLTGLPQLTPTTTLPSYPTTPLTLTDLFNEAGWKVGVPPKILEAIMRNECSTPFTLTSEEINLYSQPGGMVPFCLTRECGDTGPMQFTIGVDDRGDPNCPRCGAVISGAVSSCPNAWAWYATSVNRYGGYSHNPNPLNIRDSIYATAAKLKQDSGATDPLNWTQEQVFEAAYRYSGCRTCRYSWLGNRTYGEYLWDYYTNK